MLNVIKLCKFSPIIRSYILLKFVSRLPSQITPVNQKENPPCLSEFYQSVGEADGGKSLSSPRSHLDKGLWS